MLKENKAKLYIYYAIGEIVLVVIGILIALQIDNLNEDRKNRKFEKDILTQIQSNLEKDKLTLEKISKNFETAVKSSDKILNAELSITDEDSIKIWLGAIILFDRFQPLTNAYEVLKSKGLDKVTNKELQFLLGTYYDDEATHMIKVINDIEFAFNKFWTPFLVTEIEEFQFKNFVELKDYSVLLKPSKTYNIIKLNRDNFGGGFYRINKGIDVIEKIQNLIKEEIL